MKEKETCANLRAKSSQAKYNKQTARKNIGATGDSGNVFCCVGLGIELRTSYILVKQFMAELYKLVGLSPTNLPPTLSKNINMVKKSKIWAGEIYQCIKSFATKVWKPD